MGVTAAHEVVSGAGEGETIDRVWIVGSKGCRCLHRYQTLQDGEAPNLSEDEFGPTSILAMG